ncbi:ABC transporter permease [Rhodoplanes sp. Z2-YC6860]|uniref:ABC transporter permease n=1 Tax=Rhodoplanes sp. Z2-YC6860 TaxID=674703 RepID=UPI0012EE86C4|nr:iron ABC transporter permease [Rhodoplanes sp. Z2-YC6860]
MLSRPATAIVALSALLCVVLYLVLPPLGTLLFGAITDTPPATAPHFTLETLIRAWSEATIYPALVNSLVFAALTATLTMLAAILLLWITERTDARVRMMADIFVLAPIVMPAVVLVNGWIMLLSPRSGMINLLATSWLGMSGPPFDIFSFPGMIWIAVLQELPLAFLWLWPSFRTMNPELEEAGFAAGAGVLEVIRRITVPMLTPALLGAWIIFFIYALGALSVPLLIGKPVGIYLFSTEIYLAATQFPTDLNIASAYSLLFLAFSFLGIALYRRLTRNIDQFAMIRGRAYRPRRFRLGKARPFVELGVALLIGLVAVLPFLVLLWNALVPFPQAPSVASLGIVSFDNFKAAWNYGPAQRALRNSLLLGLLAGVLTTTLAFAIAWCNQHLRGHPRTIALIDQLAGLPVALPGLVVGIGMTWFYLEVPLPIYGTPAILLLAYIMLHLPYAVRIAGAGLTQLHPELEEAGRVAGATEPRVMARIVVPLLAPSLLGSALYVMLRAFREYAASIFLVAPGLEVVAVLVLDMSQSGNSNILAAYTVMITAIMTIAAIVFHRIERWAAANTQQ